ncbi:unnamed protein product [Clonostachys rhizophaga]|uniref:Uncharacterized protein n=1 Tax=Clonostachys rhizophaga TaxID=160324 RepID=A0A9N9YES0_9HYPO|nr:unnamed protein product [Clonostachys rhizophaga]
MASSALRYYRTAVGAADGLKECQTSQPPTRAQLAGFFDTWLNSRLARMAQKVAFDEFVQAAIDRSLPSAADARPMD